MAAGVLRDGRRTPARRRQAARSTGDDTTRDDTAVDDTTVDDLVEVLAALRVAPQQVPDARTNLTPTAIADPAPAAAPPDLVRTTSNAAPNGPRSMWAIGRLVAAVIVLGALGGATWVFSQRSADATLATPPAATSTGTAPTDAPPVVSVQVSVLGAKDWTDSGVSCAPGHTVDLNASGIVLAAPTVPVGPDGTPNPAYRPSNLQGLEAANHAALVASVDRTAPFAVVGSSATYACPAAGKLYLGVNDVGLENNSGQWTVTVTPDE